MADHPASKSYSTKDSNSKKSMTDNSSIAGRPSDALKDDTFGFREKLDVFLQSDSIQYWDYDGTYSDVGLKAVYLTDTGNIAMSSIALISARFFRKFGQPCRTTQAPRYHYFVNISDIF